MRKKKLNLLLLPGDGIGPEIMEELKKILFWISDHTHITFKIEHGHIGGTAYNSFGSPYPQETKDQVAKADAIMVGAVGGTDWYTVDFDFTPEKGLLALREDLDLYASLRPCFLFDCITPRSPLKKKLASGLNMITVRELRGGMYYGEPRGVEPLVHGGERGYNTLSYTTEEVYRIAKEAFDVAMRGNKRVCNVDMANVLETMQLWRKIVTEVAKDYPEVELTHMLVAEAHHTLVKDPSFFDVVLTPNMIGDVFSDLAAALTGSPNIIPSGSFGHLPDGTQPPALYHPLHGSMPDIAGKGKANPIAMILCLTMLLKHTLNEVTIADGLTKSVEDTLADGFRTEDMKEDNCTVIGTSQMGDEICKRLGKNIPF